MVKNYNLIFDLLAAAPINLICAIFAISHISWIIGLIKLIRIIKIVNIIKRFGDLAVLPSVYKVQFATICFIVAINWIATGWMLIYPRPELDPYSFYNISLYWAVTTLTTIGYGDITPSTNFGRIYTMLVMILGVGVYGIVIGNISRMLAMADRHKEQSKEKLQDLNLFMRHYNVSDQLRYAVFSYYNYILTRRLTDNDSKIISDLPQALQLELKIYMNVKLVGSVPSFQQCTNICLKEIAASLDQMYFSPGEEIMRKGDVGNEMYIIGHGNVDVYATDENIVSTLQDGQCFGESALLHECKRNSTVRAQTYCDIYKLDKKDFLNIIKRHPDLMKNMKQALYKRSSDRQN